MKVYLRVIYNWLRLFGLSKICGKNIRYGKIQMLGKHTKLRMDKNSRTVLGNKTITEDRGNIYVGSGAELSIGDAVYMNDGIIISCKKMINIGQGCVFGPDVKIYDNNHKFYRNVGVSGTEYSTGSIEIGKNCWIGANVTVLKGANIGDNSVIGAGSIIEGKIPDNSMVTSDRKLIIREIERKA